LGVFGVVLELADCGVIDVGDFHHEGRKSTKETRREKMRLTEGREGNEGCGAAITPTGVLGDF
jgi:hypothetical protein